MGQDQAAQFRNTYLEMVALGFLIRDGEQQQRHSTYCLPVAFDGSKLDRLMLHGVQAVEIADHRLCRRADQDQPQAHGQCPAVGLHLSPAQQVPGADARHHEGPGEEGSHYHVGETIGERGVEDRLTPAGDAEHAVRQFSAGRGVHPAVGRQNPERGDEGAQRHHARRKQMHARWHLVAAEQQHAEEGGLEEERRHHLVTEHRPDEVGRRVGEVAPVGAELEGHDNARHHPHREGHAEYLDPELGKTCPRGIARSEGKQLEEGDEGRQAYGEYRKNGVKAHHKSKLQAG